MGLRETKVQQRPRLKLTRKTKTTRKFKIKKRIKFKLNVLKRHPARLLPISIKKGKSNIKPLSSHTNSLSKVLEIPIPNNIYEIKTMCAILGMHLAISPKEKVAIEKKYEEILEKLIEIYSKLEMKPYRLKILHHFKEELKKSKKSFLLSKLLIKSKSKKFLELVKRYSAKSKSKSKSISTNKSRTKSNSKTISKSRSKIHGGRVVHLEGDWTDYPPLPSMTYKNCVASSYRLLNLLNGEEADELGIESANGLMSTATIKWLNEIYGEDHYLIRFWTKGQVVDNTYMEELDAFFVNLFPSNNTGTIVNVKNHFFNVVRNEFGQIVFYDLQAKWIYENENNERQYYWTIRFQDFYEFFLERINNTPFIEVVSQNYMLPNFEPTNQEVIESTHYRYGRRYALNEIRKARREKGNNLAYYEPKNENENNENNENNYGEWGYKEWGVWHDSYYTWNEYTSNDLKSIINGRTRIKFTDSQKESAGRYFFYRYGWDGIVPEGNNEENDVYDAPEYPIALGIDEYAEWETPLIFALEIEHDRYNFDLYDSSCDIGKYGEVDLPTHNDIRYDYDTLWMTWSYMKYIRFWINEYMFGNYKIATYTVAQLERMLLHYKHKNHKLIEEIPYYSTMIEEYSSPIYRDKIGIGRSNLLYATQKQLQKTINLLSTFISNIKSVINSKSGRTVYKFEQKEVNQRKSDQLFRKEATITEFRKITGDDRGCRFTKYGKGYTILGGNKNIIGGSAMEDGVVYTGDRGAGGTGFERGAANRPKTIKRNPKQQPKQTNLTITINCALDSTCPNQKTCEEYIRSPFFETRILCEPRENMEHIVRKIRQTWEDIPNLALRIIRVITPLIELYEFTDLPAVTILEYIYANTEEDKEALVGEKFMDSLFYDKAIQYIFTEEFFDKAMSEQINWSMYDSFTDPKMSEEEIEEIQEHINNMASRYNSDYVIIEESYGEYSGGYLNSLIPIYISESIIQKPLMSDNARAAVTAYMATDDHYTTEYIENIRTRSWPIDEAGFHRRTATSMYEHYAYEDVELY